MLTILLTIEPEQNIKLAHGTWMGRFTPAYPDCLQRKEPLALVLLARPDTRRRSKCTAICMKLEDSRDPISCKLLEFPAQRCGYSLGNVQKQTAVESPIDVILA